MSPEQALGKRAEDASDLYSVGIMLFEMLTGRVPFRSDSLALLLSKQASEPPPSMHETAPDALIPRDLCEIVDKLLEKRPKDRYESATELVAALDAADLSPFVPGLPDASSSADDVDDSGKVTIPAARDLSDSSDADEDSGDAIAPLTDSVMPQSDKSMKNLAVAGAAILVITLVFAGGLAVLFSKVTADGEGEGLTGSASMTFSEDEAPTDLQGEQRVFLQSHDLVGLVDLPGAEAVSKIQPVVDGAPESAHGRYFLARSLAKDGKVAEAMEQYETVLEADPRYLGDDRLIADACEGLSARNRERKAAARVYAKLLAGDNPGPARDALVALAISGNIRGRKAAKDALEDAKLWDGLQSWEQASIELQLVSKKQCPTALKHVKTIEEAGEPKALPALEAASKRPRKGCGIFKNEDCYKCVRPALAKAIEKLQARP